MLDHVERSRGEMDEGIWYCAVPEEAALSKFSGAASPGVGRYFVVFRSKAGPMGLDMPAASGFCLRLFADSWLWDDAERQWSTLPQEPRLLISRLRMAPVTIRQPDATARAEMAVADE